MKILLAIILATVTAQGASVTTAPAPVVGKVTYIVPTMSAGTITGIVGRAASGSQLWFYPGRYHIPTNTITWARPGVDYYFQTPCTMVWGSAGDAVARPVFEFSAASTNRLYGRASFVVSNSASIFGDLQASGSRMIVEGQEVLRQLTGTTPNFKIADGCAFGIDLNGNVENWGYDAFYFTGSGAGVRLLNFRVGGTVFVEDSAIEFSGAFDAGFTGVFNVGAIDRRNTTANVGGLLAVGLNMVLNVGSIGGSGTNWYIAFDSTFAGSPLTKAPGVINCPYIRLDAAHASNPYLFQAFTPGRWRVLGAEIHGPTNSAAALAQIYGAELSFEDCILNTAARNSSITNSIVQFDAGTGAEVLELKGTTFNSPVERALNPKFYLAPPFLTNVNNTVSLVEGVTDVLVRTLASSGAKSIILTNAVRYIRGHRVLVKDSAGTASNASSNLLVKAATGNIDGVAGSTGKTISTDYGAFLFWCDGTNWWSR